MAFLIGAMVTYTCFLIAASLKFVMDAATVTTGLYLRDVIDRFSMAFHQQAYFASCNETCITSPLAAHISVMMYTNAAGPAAVAQAIQVFRPYKNNLCEANCQVRALSRDLYDLSRKCEYFCFINKFYLTNEANMTQFFLDVAREYKAELASVDPKKASQISAEMNGWVRAVTRGNLYEVVRASDFKPNALITVLHTVYFHGNFAIPFQNTGKKKFHVNTFTRNKIRFMSVMLPPGQLEYAFLKDIDAQVIKLPYQQEEFSLVVIIPNTIDGLVCVMDKLPMYGLKPIIRQLDYQTETKLLVEVPIFNVDSDVEIHSIYAALGVTAIFMEPACDVLRDFPVTVSTVLHKVNITVDDVASDDSTGFLGIRRVIESDPTRECVCDRPFFFALLKEDIVIITGTFNGEEDDNESEGEGNSSESEF